MTFEICADWMFSFIKMKWTLSLKRARVTDKDEILDWVLSKVLNVINRPSDENVLFIIIIIIIIAKTQRWLVTGERLFIQGLLGMEFILYPHMQTPS